MNILLLGATGRTGRLVLAEALAQGHTVHALVRRPARLQAVANQYGGQLRLFEGQPTDGAVLAQAMAGCQGVVGVLNVSRTSDFPWAPLRTPPTLLSDTMRQVITLGQQRAIQKVVVCSAWGVGDTKNHLPGWFRWFINNSNIGVAYTDHERQEQLLAQSGLPYTIVRPVGLTNGKRQQQVQVSYSNQPKPRLTINRLTVARFLLSALTDDALTGRAPVISR